MKRSSQFGISLVEILVTLAIFSILSAIAAPSIQTLIKNNRVRAVTDEFTSSLYQARSEAVKRNNRVTMCASNATQDNCDNGVDTDFSGGWIIFTDYDNDQTVDPIATLFDTTGDGVDDTPEQILFVSGVPAGNIEIDANVNAYKRVLTYRSNGLLDGNSRFSFLLQDLDKNEQVSKITISMTGRARQCIGDTTKCP